MKVIKLGEVITKTQIPAGIASDNINGPTVFKRPKFYPNGPQWIMYFAHHRGDGIRTAESEELSRGWKVSNKLILGVETGHVASPEVLLHQDRLELYFHREHNDFQYTFKATTEDGERWVEDDEVQGDFYLRTVGEQHAVAKHRNQGGIWYKRTNGKLVEQGRLLPKMRHCCHCEGKLYWSEIGDNPEVIYRGDLNLSKFTVSNKQKIIMPSEHYEVTKNHRPSLPGSAVGVTEVRDPYAIKSEGKTFIFYTVRGEEAIAVAEIQE
jgi:hypothetical protein